MQYVTDAVPLWTWRLVRAALAGVIFLGVAGVLALIAGAADPQRAGPLVQELGPLPEIAVSARSDFALNNPIELPAPPFTLEITARLAAKSDPAAAWGLQFDSATTGIMLNGYRFMAVLPGDLMPFIHVRGLGESNKITLDVDSQNQASFRINDELAWRGIMPVLHSAKIAVHGGAESNAWLTVLQIALYTPQNMPKSKRR